MIPDLPKARGPDDCAAEDWLAFLGHRWTALTLWRLRSGALRFSEIQAVLPGIRPKVLTERLSGLQARGLVEKRMTNAFPREVSYALTPRGQDLAGILGAFYDWAVTAVD